MNTPSNASPFACNYTTISVMTRCLLVVFSLLTSFVAYGEGLFSAEAVKWLPKGSATKIEQAMLAQNFNQAYILLNQALIDQGIDLNDTGFRKALQDKTPPAEVLYPTVICSLLANKSNLAYGLLRIQDIKPDEMSQYNLSWERQVDLWCEANKTNSFLLLLQTDAKLRCGKFEQNEQLAEDLITQLQTQQTNTESQLLSMAYSNYAQTLMMMYCDSLFAENRELEKITDLQARVAAKTAMDNISKSDRNNMMATAEQALRMACDVKGATLESCKPTKSIVADAYVSYAMFKLTTGYFGPSAVDEFAKKCLNLDSNNFYALLLISKYDPNDPILKSKVASLQGVFTGLNIGFNVDLKNRSFGGNIGVKGAVVTPIGGIAGWFKENVNMKDLVSLDLPASSLGYPGMYRLTQKEN